MALPTGLMRRRAAWGAALLLFALGPAAGAGEAAAKTTPASRQEITYSFAPVVRRAAPAVVNIYTRTVIEQPGSPLSADSFFRRFFGDQFFGVPRRRTESTLGSGVIVDANGTIVTNHHVIKGAEQIAVVLSDRREFEARLVGSDERSDIAVLKIEAGAGLPLLRFGDSDAVEVGDLVIAIGDPFGVGQTVTSGIVSALARTAVGVGDFDFFIQTDAAINPGNSGGPLVTMDGKMIGLNTAIYSQSGGSVGIGFAIPSNMVRTVVASIVAGGRLARAWLGVQGESVTPDIAETLGLARPSGVLVDEVYAEGPASRAGVRAGDVILKVDGRPVDDADSLRYRVATKPVNTTASLTINRKGRQLTLPIALAAPPESVPREATDIAGDFPLSGLTVVNLSPAVAEELGIDSFQRGVAVSRVSPGTPAARLGFKPGDVILSLNGVEMASVHDLKDVIGRQPTTWRLSFRRGGRVLNVVISS